MNEEEAKDIGNDGENRNETQSSDHDGKTYQHQDEEDRQHTTQGSQGNVHDSLDSCQDCHNTNQYFDSQETQFNNAENEKEGNLSEDKIQGEIDGSGKDQSNDEDRIRTSFTPPHTCTYYRGPRSVFVASKRQGADFSQAIQTIDKGKIKLRRSKRLRKTTQGPEFIDLDSDEQDEEMTTKMLLLEKDAQIKEWEEDFERARNIIRYYKD